MTAPILRVERVSLVPRILASQLDKQTDSLNPAVWVLQDVSFSVLAGDRIALVGASGSGKTSLLRLLNRLSHPFRGDLFFQEQSFRQIPPVELRQHIVLVLQETRLLGMTVRQAVEYPLKLRHLDSATMRQRLATGLEQLHIPSGWLDRTETQLSVGQRQLVAIARALVTQPTILLLDEPTASLDAARTQTVIQVLQDLSQHQSLTILMTTHQLDIARQFCSRVLHLDQGRLVQDTDAAQMDWQTLRDSLVIAESRDRQEWQDES